MYSGRRGYVNWLFINNGDGTFGNAIQFDANDPEFSTEACAFGDLNNDGYVDLFVGAGAEFEPLATQYSPNNTEVFNTYKIFLFYRKTECST